MNTATRQSASFRFSSIDFPLDQRWDVCRTYNPLREMHTVDEADSSFRYEHCDTPFGPFALGSQKFWADDENVREREYELRRTQSLIRSDGFDFYCVGYTGSENLEIDADGLSVKPRPSDLFVLDISRPYSLTMPGGELVMLTIPRALIQSGESKLHGMVLQGQMSLIFSEYLRSLSRRIATLGFGEVNYAAQATLNLLRATLVPGADQIAIGQTDVENSMMARVKRYIEQNLESPELGQESICRQVGISRSQLYRLFTEIGGIALYIRRCRLVRAKADLMSVSASSQRISGIAYQYGFASNAHFSRAFKQHFGHTPSDSIEASRKAARIGDLETALDKHDYGRWLRQNGL